MEVMMKWAPRRRNAAPVTCLAGVLDFLVDVFVGPTRFSPLTGAVRLQLSQHGELGEKAAPAGQDAVRPGEAHSSVRRQKALCCPCASRKTGNRVLQLLLGKQTDATRSAVFCRIIRSEGREGSAFAELFWTCCGWACSGYLLRRFP